MSEAHPKSESESKSDNPDIVVAGNIVEERPKTSSHGPFHEHRIRSSCEEKKAAIAKGLDREHPIIGEKGFPEVFRNLFHVLRKIGNCSL